MDQKTQFIADYLRRSLSVTEFCEHYGISRKTGYKWIERYERGGPAGLAERSRRPHVCPTQTPEEVVRALTEARQRHPSWGAKKLLAFLSGRHPDRLGRPAPPSATSSLGTAWSGNHERAAAWATPAILAPR